MMNRQLNDDSNHATTQHFHGKPTVEQVLAMVYYTFGKEYKDPIQEELNRLRIENNQLNARVKELEADIEKIRRRMGASSR